MKRFFNAFYERTGIVKDAGQRSVASRVSALGVEGFIFFTLLGTLGVDTTPLMTAAGVTGATIGFACKDFGANFVASVALAGQSTLKTGNKVTIGLGTNAVSGTVVDWDTRYLYLRNSDNAVVSVPNNLILNSVVVWSNPGADAPGKAKHVSGTAAEAADWKAAASSAESPKK